MACCTLATVLLVISSCYTSALCAIPEEDTTLQPDKLMLQQAGRQIWQNRYSIIESVEERELLTSERAADLHDYFLEETDLQEDQPEEFITCLQCRTFLAALISFVNQGLTFDDIRDFAVDVCYNVTPALGWNGEVMCEGMIDNFGPHVYWVLNETDKNAEGICQFHRVCPEDEVKTVKKTWHHSKSSRHGKAEEKPIVATDKKYKKKKAIMKIAHLTDVHLDEQYTPGAPAYCEGLPVCCRDYLPGTGEAAEWVTYNCALSIPTLHVMLRFINDLGVDLVINTGDTPNHALWEETQEGQIRQSEILADGIRVYIPGVPTFLTLGNHDVFPTNQYYGPSPYVQEVLQRLRLRYQDLANFTPEEIRTFEHGGYYTRVLMPGLRLMAYNSEYGYTDNYYGVLLEETEDWNNMTQWMEQTFDAARENGEKILLLSHHPQGGGFTFWHDFITDIMERNGDLVLLHLFGHTHRDAYRMALNEEGDAYHVNIQTVSLTSQRNPGFKIFYIDTDTMTPVDFETYIINVTRSVEEGEEPEVELLYSASADYLMPDLTPASFQDFTDRMEQDDGLYYLYRYNTETQKDDPGSCEDDCKKDFFCDLRSLSREDKTACMASFN